MTSQSTTNDTATTMDGYLEALLSGDLERIRAFFAPDATWWIHGDLPLSGTYDGADAIMAFLSAAMGQLFVPGTQRFSFGELIVDGPTAVLEWNVTGTATATGRRYDNDYCGLFTIRDGQISRVREYFDSAHVRDVLYR